jgi:NAD(P)-dependent dehydrogenase (short-subunit alcohol dehydrogenase family)
MGCFKGKVLLITGAASGIGKAVALEFARHGVGSHSYRYCNSPD